MASFSETELNATIDEKWDMVVNDARYANATIMPRINNRTAFVTKSGDIVNITVQAKYTVGDVGSNGAFVPQITTPASFALTINQHRQVAIEVEDRAKALFLSPKYAVLIKRVSDNRVYSPTLSSTCTKNKVSWMFQQCRSVPNTFVYKSISL